MSTVHNFCKSLLVVCSAVFILTACQNSDFGSLASSSDNEISYNFIYDQADHLKDIIQDKDWKTADKLFATHRDFFNDLGRKEINYKLLSVVAKGINREMDSELIRSLNDLNNISVPPPEAEWETISSKIERAGIARNNYNKYSITKLPQFQSIAYKNLDSALNSKTILIRNNAENEFKSFDISGGSDFFKLYPTSINTSDFFSSKEYVWNEKISNMNPSQLELIHQVYWKYLPSELKDTFSALYYEKTVDELSRANSIYSGS